MLDRSIKLVTKYDTYNATTGEFEMTKLGVDKQFRAIQRRLTVDSIGVELLEPLTTPMYKLGV